MVLMYNSYLQTPVLYYSTGTTDRGPKTRMVAACYVTERLKLCLRGPNLELSSTEKCCMYVCMDHIYIIEYGSHIAEYGSTG